MTPEERAAAVYADLAGRDQDCPADVEAIAATIRAVVMEDREACEPVVAELLAMVEGDLGRTGEPDEDCEPFIVRGRQLLAAIRSRP